MRARAAAARPLSHGPGAVLHEAVHRAAQDPAFVEALTHDGGEMALSESPQAFGRFWREQRQVLLAELVRMTGARVA
jgi:hypothetical protein